MTGTSGDLMATRDAALEPRQGPRGTSEAPYVPPTDRQRASREKRAPSVEDVQKWAFEDKAFWEPRNRRMQEDQDLFDLRPIHDQAVAQQRGEVHVYVNDPKFYITKPSGMLARKKYRIEVPPKGAQNADRAQRAENTCRWWDDYCNRQWVQGLHNPLPYDRAQQLLLRGWIAERLTLDHDSPALVRDQLFDPYNIYPRLYGDRIKHVCHAYEARPDDVLSDFPDAKRRLRAYREEEYVKCVAYYDNEPPYWHGVLAGDTWAKQPKSLGYFPWVLAIAQGSVSHHRLGMSYDDERARSVGVGMLEGVRGMIEMVNALVTMLANVVAKSENPPTLIKTIDGRPKQFKMHSGARNFFTMGEDVRAFDVGPNAGQMMSLLSTFQDRINKATFPGVMFGEGTNMNSGFQAALLTNAAYDTLWMWIEALQVLQENRFEKFLTLFRDFAKDDMEIYTRSKGDSGLLNQYGGRMSPGIERGKYVWGEKLTVEDLTKNGTMVRIEYPDVTPQDRVALSQVATMLAREKLISMHTARTKYLEIDDPEAENDRIVAEGVYLNPDAMKVLTRAELKRQGFADELKALEEAEKPPPPVAGPGVPSPLGALGVPLEGVPQGMPGPEMLGLPPQAMPPEQTGLVEGPTEEDLMAAIIGLPGGM